MKKLIVNSKPRPISQANATSSLYNKQLSITYGTIDSNNEDGTCNIKLVNGFIMENVKIPSSFYPSSGPVIGGIIYPPIGSEVRIIHPSDDINSGFILPASLNSRDEAVSDALLGQGNKEIIPGGWSKTFNYETGNITVTNGTFELILDPDGNLVSYTDFQGNTIKSNGATLEINGIIKVAREGDTVTLSLTGADISSLASSLLATGAFTPSGSPPVPGTPISFTGGAITSGSNKVKVG